MSTVLKSSDEIIRRAVRYNGVYLGSVTANEADAIDYFRHGVWLGLPPVEGDEPRTWTADPVLM